MTINFIKLTKAFWELHEQHRFTGNEVLLYWKVVDLFNEEGDGQAWPDTIQQPDPTLCYLTGLSQNTMDKARNTLKTRGLLHFDPAGKGFRKGTTYHLLTPKRSSKRTSERLSNFDNLSGKDHQKDHQKEDQILTTSFIYKNTKPIKQNKHTHTLLARYGLSLLNDGIFSKNLPPQTGKLFPPKPPATQERQFPDVTDYLNPDTEPDHVPRNLAELEKRFVDWELRLRLQTDYLNKVQGHFKISDRQTLFRLISDFTTEQSANEKWHTDFLDYRKHFWSTLKDEARYQAKQATKKSTPKASNGKSVTKPAGRAALDYDYDSLDG